jgi:biotin carboxylase
MEYMNKAQKALIHIGASGLQLDTLRWAKRSGLYVIATDIDSNAPGINLADEFHNISGIDVGSLLDLAKEVSKKYTLVGVYCNSDFSLTAAAQINKIYGLKGCFPDAVEASIDKTKAKELMLKSNIPVPNGITVSGDQFSFSDCSHLRFPMIVKPVDSCGSQGVKYIYDLEGMRDGIGSAVSYSNNVLIEEFIVGDGIDTIGIMSQGKLYPCGLGLRFFSELPFRFPTHGYANTGLSRLHQEEAYRITQEAAVAVGIMDGPVKADLIFYEGSFTVLEVTPRFHGDVFTNKMIPYATGFYPAIELFNFLMTGKLSDYSVLDIQPKYVLWKALFPLVKNIDWAMIERDNIDGEILDVYINPRFEFGDANHNDNTSLAGFMWVELDSNDSMSCYSENFKSRYDGLLI